MMKYQVHMELKVGFCDAGFFQQAPHSSPVLLPSLFVYRRGFQMADAHQLVRFLNFFNQLRFFGKGAFSPTIYLGFQMCNPGLLCNIGEAINICI